MLKPKTIRFYVNTNLSATYFGRPLISDLQRFFNDPHNISLLRQRSTLYNDEQQEYIPKIDAYKSYNLNETIINDVAKAIKDDYDTKNCMGIKGLFNKKMSTTEAHNQAIQLMESIIHDPEYKAESYKTPSHHTLGEDDYMDRQLIEYKFIYDPDHAAERLVEKNTSGDWKGHFFLKANHCNCSYDYLCRNFMLPLEELIDHIDEISEEAIKKGGYEEELQEYEEKFGPIR